MKKKISINTIVLCGMFAAVIAVLCPWSIPIGAVPVTLCTFAISLVSYTVGAKYGVISSCIYILLGAIGVPVFSSFRGGLQILIGATGGYIIGYPVMAAITSNKIIIKHLDNKYIPIVQIAQGLVGLLVLYAIGTVQFMFVMKVSLIYALAVCVVPFIIKDIILVVIGYALARGIKRAIPSHILRTDE